MWPLNSAHPELNPSPPPWYLLLFLSSYPSNETHHPLGWRQKTWATSPIPRSLAAAPLPRHFPPLALSASLPLLESDPHPVWPESLCQCPLWPPHYQPNSLLSTADRALLLNMNLTWSLPPKLLSVILMENQTCLWVMKVQGALLSCPLLQTSLSLPHLLICLPFPRCTLPWQLPRQAVLSQSWQDLSCKVSA